MPAGGIGGGGGMAEGVIPGMVTLLCVSNSGGDEGSWIGGGGGGSMAAEICPEAVVVGVSAATLKSRGRPSGIDRDEPLPPIPPSGPPRPGVPRGGRAAKLRRRALGELERMSDAFLASTSLSPSRLFGVASRLFGVLSRAATATLRLAVFTTARARDAKCSVESDSWSDSTLGETVQSITPADEANRRRGR